MTIQSVIEIPAFSAQPAPNLKVDYLTKGGAQILADRIMRMWKLRGGCVKAWVEAIPGSSRIGNTGGALLYAVRSDLRNGVPR